MTTQYLAVQDLLGFARSEAYEWIATGVILVIAVGIGKIIQVMFSKHGGIGAAIATALGVIVLACLVGGAIGFYQMGQQTLRKQGVQTVNVNVTPYGT